MCFYLAGGVQGTLHPIQIHVLLHQSKADQHSNRQKWMLAECRQNQRTHVLTPSGGRMPPSFWGCSSPPGPNPAGHRPPGSMHILCCRIIPAQLADLGVTTQQALHAGGGGIHKYGQVWTSLSWNSPWTLGGDKGRCEGVDNRR